MDFDLTSEQKEIWRWARDFSDKEIAPRVQENDWNCRFDWDLCKKLSEQGFFSLILPEQYGGQGLDYISYAIMTEEIARVCSSTRTLFSVQISLVQITLLTYGTEEQKQKYLPKLATGEMIGCFGLTEPDAGSDAGNQRTTFREEADCYVLNGQKTWISNGSIAHLAIVFATEDRNLKHKGISAFLIEKTTPGFTAREMQHKLGLKASDTSELFFEEVRIPKDAMLGKRGEGFKIAMYGLDQGRFSVAAGGVGVMQGCIDISTKYAMERKQFDQEIGRFQMIQALIADMVADCEAGRLLVWRAADRKNKGVRNTRETSLAKFFCSEAAIRAANSAVQVFGGYGFSGEYPAERYYRDARVLNLYEGTSQIQRLIIGQDALGIRFANGDNSANNMYDQLVRLAQ